MPSSDDLERTATWLIGVGTFAGVVLGVLLNLWL